MWMCSKKWGNISSDTYNLQAKIVSESDTCNNSTLIFKEDLPKSNLHLFVQGMHYSDNYD